MDTTTTITTHTKDTIVTTACNNRDGGNSTASPDPKSQSNHPNDISHETNVTHNNNETNSTTNAVDKANESAKKDDSSSFSTAFTISFEDENNASKRLSIKDSIRKFAPPKPNTIEKPRPPKADQNQENSFNSIESAPGGLSKHSARFERLSAKRSSERKSNLSSMHSSISDSAAFLIDKMLNPNQQQLSPVKVDNAKSNLPPKSPRSRATKELPSPKHIQREHRSTTTTTTSKATRAAGSMLDGEVDFSEDRSDNGTYIVGADPESEAARKKIDELFGVVKAAEESVIAASISRQLESGGDGHSSRRSRASDKKPLSHERQERINRLARRSTSASRSSSSSRHDNLSSEQQQQQPRITSRHGSRNSSCDRTSKQQPYANRPKRSTSQSSRHSSGRDVSENDTRSSKSSLHIDNDSTSQDNQLPSHPSMKFNRAFALRRARLGLGEPSRNIPLLSQNLSQETESSHNYSNSNRGGAQLISNPPYRASQQSAGSANFSRDDGGRFSLRMRNNLQPNRIPTSTTSDRSHQHNTVLEGLINRVTGNNNSGKAYNVSSQYKNLIASKHTQQQYTSIVSSTVPNQSSDEQEALSPSRYRTVIKSTRLPRKAHSELDQEEGSPLRRLNYSAGNDHDLTFKYDSNSRAGSSGGTRPGRGSTALQLGALDSLVISAISSLSLKIRQSVCDVLIEQAKKLPNDNETRLVVEEILPQLVAPSSGPKSPTSIEEIDQSLYFDLAKTLKNLKKVEQMVDVINLISNQLTSSSPSPPSSSSIPLDNTKLHSMNQKTGIRSSDSAIAQRTSNSLNDLSPV